MSNQIGSTLGALHERASDLLRTLASAEEGGRMHNWPAALSHFQQLSQQLQLLTDRAGDELMQYQAVQPVALTPEPGTIPALLSTFRDPEREESLQRVKETAGEALPDGAADAHNRTLQAACQHLAAAAIKAGLPGAGTLRVAGSLSGVDDTEHKRQRRAH